MSPDLGHTSEDFDLANDMFHYPASAPQGLVELLLIFSQGGVLLFLNWGDNLILTNITLVTQGNIFIIKKLQKTKELGHLLLSRIVNLC